MIHRLNLVILFSFPLLFMWLFLLVIDKQCILSRFQMIYRLLNKISLLSSIISILHHIYHKKTTLQYFWVIFTQCWWSVSKLFNGWCCHIVNKSIIIVYHNVYLTSHLAGDHYLSLLSSNDLLVFMGHLNSMLVESLSNLFIRQPYDVIDIMIIIV